MPVPAILGRRRGAILTFGDNERELKGGDPHTTNNRMELMAAISALEAHKRRCTIDLHTDSEYVKNGITTWIHGLEEGRWRTARRPVEMLIYGSVWMKRSLLQSALALGEGHGGHAMNERADELAREA